MALLHRWPRRAPALDDRIVGITFVDVLFALVIGEVLEPLRHPGDIPGVGFAHLSVATVLTLTSWVGYHNSGNRPRHFIRFPNLPLFQFLLDILMVVAYWSTAVSAETKKAIPSATPEALLVAAAFILYVFWDSIGFAIRRNPEYRQRKIEQDQKDRRSVTRWFCAAAVVAAGLTWRADSHSFRVIVATDVFLVALLIAFRFVKEYVTDEGSLAAPDPDERQLLDDLDRVVRDLRRRQGEP